MPLVALSCCADAHWWMDAHTRRLLEDMIDLRPTLTFSVGPGPPVTLTRQQVRMGTMLGKVSGVHVGG